MQKSYKMRKMSDAISTSLTLTNENSLNLTIVLVCLVQYNVSVSGNHTRVSRVKVLASYHHIKGDISLKQGRYQTS